MSVIASDVRDSKTVQGIARAIASRGEGEYEQVLAWAEGLGLYRFYQLFDDRSWEEVDRWFAGRSRLPAGKADRLWELEIGPAVDSVSDAFAEHLADLAADAL